MRIFPRLTYLQQRLLDLETRFNDKPVVFGVHPNEFIDESNEERNISRRSSNPVAYILQDLVRGKLKVRNLGPAALPIYERLIQFYVNNSYEFTTVKQYVAKRFAQ